LWWRLHPQSSMIFATPNIIKGTYWQALSIE
jgi:hypothetical protein